jgi:hypothetical protein
MRLTTRGRFVFLVVAVALVWGFARFWPVRNVSDYAPSYDGCVEVLSYDYTAGDPLPVACKQYDTRELGGSDNEW